MGEEESGGEEDAKQAGVVATGRRLRSGPHHAGVSLMEPLLTKSAALSSLTYGQQRGADASTMYYVSADAGPAGDGSRRRPFLLLAHAESASAAGDTIYLLSSDRGQLLDGGIALKPRQKLIGIGVNGEMLENAADRVQLTNTTALPGGVMVHFMNMGNVAISGSETDYSGTYIHHTTFSGNAREHIEDERGLVYAISFEAAEGYLDGIRIEDSGFYDGATSARYACSSLAIAAATTCFNGTISPISAGAPISFAREIAAALKLSSWIPRPTILAEAKEIQTASFPI